MKAISESCLQNRLDSGSTKRYRDYQARLRKDSTLRIYDDRAVEVLKRYAFYPEQVDSELEYLKHLKNADGELFCRSIGKYSDMEAQYDNFCAPERASFRWNRHFKAAVATVCARYAQAELKALEYQSDEDIYNAVTDWSTATGWTSIQTGLRKKVDVLSDVFLVYQSREQEAKVKGSFETPIICGTRTQGSGAYDEAGKRTNTWKSKKRAVFMVDVYTIIAESKFGHPLNQWLKNYQYTAIGKDDKWLTNYIGLCRNNGMNFISLDYSKYDSTIPSWLIHSAFDVIRAAFSEYDSTLLAVIEEDFINKNIVTGTGLIHVTHGNPSGSRLTAIINGICNEIMTETWMSALNLRGVCNIMGDDNLIYLDGIHKVDDTLVSSISQYITHNFGVKVNSDKSNFGSWRDDPEYLSRFWGFSGPYRSKGEVISLIAYPERFRPYDRKDVVLSPEMIIYSYVLAYRRTMEELMNVERFLRDVNIAYAKIEWTKEQREAVPYNIRLSVELNNFQRESLREILEANTLKAS